MKARLRRDLRANRQITVENSGGLQSQRSFEGKRCHRILHSGTMTRDRNAAGNQIPLKLLNIFNIFQQSLIKKVRHLWTPRDKSWNRTMTCIRLTNFKIQKTIHFKMIRLSLRDCAVSTFVLAAASSSQTQANEQALKFGCPSTISRVGDVIVQGNNGVFFRQKPDLDVYFPISAHIAGKLGHLSRVLERRGVRLVLVPVPARGTAMARHLHGGAPELTQGFDANLARRSYDMLVAQVKKNGVAVVNLMPALESTSDGKDYFLTADHHWNALGSEEAAKEIAKFLASDLLTKDLVRAEHSTRSTGSRTLVSQMRRTIQLGCVETVPSNTVGLSETASVEGGVNGALDIFGSSTVGTTVALTGTSFSDVDAFNFDGFITQHSGLQVTNFAVSGGNQFVSIAAFLTSPGFAEAPPKVIVWENPVYNNYGEFGDRPLDELIAAASGECEAGTGTDLPLMDDGDGVTAINVPVAKANMDTYFQFDSGLASTRSASFSLNYTNGLVVPQIIERPDRFNANGRFYVKAGKPKLSSIRIVSPGMDATTAKLTACQLPNTGE